MSTKRRSRFKSDHQADRKRWNVREYQRMPEETIEKDLPIVEGRPWLEYRFASFSLWQKEWTFWFTSRTPKNAELQILTKTQKKGRKTFGIPSPVTSGIPVAQRIRWRLDLGLLFGLAGLGNSPCGFKGTLQNSKKNSNQPESTRIQLNKIELFAGDVNAEFIDFNFFWTLKCLNCFKTPGELAESAKISSRKASRIQREYL